jgi:hypothetical protein
MSIVKIVVVDPRGQRITIRVRGVRRPIMAHCLSLLGASGEKYAENQAKYGNSRHFAHMGNAIRLSNTRDEILIPI